MRNTLKVGLIASAMMLFLAACAVPTTQHVGQSSAGMFFDLPREWSSISAPVLKKAQSSWTSSDGGQAYVDALKWQGVWSPQSELSPLVAFGNDAPDVPVVYAAVRTLYDVETQNISSDTLSALQDVVIPVSSSNAGDGLDIQMNQSYLQNSLNAVRQKLSWNAGGVQQTIDTRIVLGKKNNVVYIFWVRCSDTCRTAHANAIAGALKSLTVKEPSVG